MFKTHLLMNVFESNIKMILKSKFVKKITLLKLLFHRKYHSMRTRRNLNPIKTKNHLIGVLFLFNSYYCYFKA